MADEIVVMRDGIVEQSRHAARALRPAGEPVRGRLHRLAGDELHARRLAPRRQRCASGVRGRHLRCPSPCRRSGVEGQQVIYGTRPEHLALAAGDEGVATRSRGGRAHRRRHPGCSPGRRPGGRSGVPRAPRFPPGRNDPPAPRPERAPTCSTPPGRRLHRTEPASRRAAPDVLQDPTTRRQHMTDDNRRRFLKKTSARGRGRRPFP